MKCPFCDEDGFDLIGLKLHLIKWCYKFNELDVIQAILDERKEASN